MSKNEKIKSKIKPKTKPEIKLEIKPKTKPEIKSEKKLEKNEEKKSNPGDWKESELIYKDDFKRGLGCPKMMWLMRHRFDPKVQEWAKERLVFLDRSEREEFQTQFQVDSIANRIEIQSLTESRIFNGVWFEHLVAVHFSKHYRFFSFPRRIDRRLDRETTLRILNDRRWDIFWHPYFRSGSYVIEVDFLKRNGDRFDLYEVKAITNLGTKRIRNSLQSDLVYQYQLIKKSGVPIGNVYLVYLDRSYIRDDGEINVRKLMAVTNGFDRPDILNTNEAEDSFVRSKRWIQRPFDDEMKRFLIESTCEELRGVRECTHIASRIKSEFDWTQLYRMKRTTKAQLFHDTNNPERDLDLLQINYDQKCLSDKHRRQIRVLQGLEEPIINKAELRSYFEKYRFPIYFFDFETSQFAVPHFPNSSAYNQIPFQYAITILKTPDFDLKSGKDVENFEFITENRLDPRPEFLARFLKDISRYGPGSYVAYNTSFERSILKLLTPFLRNEKERNIWREVIELSLDLMDFLRDFDIYYPEFKGSLSLKKTLPSFVPELNYDKLVVKKGNEASNLYFSYMHGLIDDKKWASLSEDLKKYCGLDTWGLAKIFKRIQTLLKD